MGEQAAIRFENLSKTFGRGKKRVQAAQNLNLEIAAGQVFGFLGPNGAGKSTTIRMMMDLIRPSEGSVFLFGQHVRREHHVVEQRVGALVEGAKFYEFLTGRRNLEVLAQSSGRLDSSQIAKLLAQVGLQARADRRVKGYSTGMKQRLGLAAALLGGPDLIILDEPTNGLDPGGMQEVRQFIRELAEKEGKTVFLSSHLLGEVEQICDRVAIIHRGTIVREGRVADLLAGETGIRVEVDAIEHAAALLERRWSVSQNGRWLDVGVMREETPSVIETLVDEGIRIYQVKRERKSLEEYFLSVTRESDENG